MSEGALEKMTIDGDRTVAELATEHMATTRVFTRHGIDYCCAGDMTLKEVCEGRDLDPEVVLDAIREELASNQGSEERWDEAPLDALVEHIVVAYHGPLRRELPRLEEMARRVCDAHRDKEPDLLPELLSVYLTLEAELREHMMKEEEILFPMITRGEGFMAEAPVSVMEDEHRVAAEALRYLRRLTDGYRVPAAACATWRALWQGLAALEESLHRHIHLENNILFPRALAS